MVLGFRGYGSVLYEFLTQGLLFCIPGVVIGFRVQSSIYRQVCERRRRNPEL